MTPDLEPIRQAAHVAHSVLRRRQLDTLDPWLDLYARDAPTLLAELDRLREENSSLRARVQKLEEYRARSLPAIQTPFND